eukprot:scaffold31882_cov36-Tisochrysis_lutea.AAC.2
MIGACIIRCSEARQYYNRWNRATLRTSAEPFFTMLSVAHAATVERKQARFHSQRRQALLRQTDSFRPAAGLVGHPDHQFLG